MTIRKTIAGLALAFLVLRGCSTEADKVRYNLSQEADNFNIQRRLTVFNIRTDTVLYQMEGRFVKALSCHKELWIYLSHEEVEMVCIRESKDTDFS